MAKTLEQGRAKWQRKMQRAGSNWKSGVSGKGGAYAEGLGASVGGPVSGEIVTAWQQGVDATSADDFQRSVQGKDGKWAENFRRAVMGG